MNLLFFPHLPHPPVHSVWNKVTSCAVQQWFSYSTRLRVHVTCHSLRQEGMCRYVKSQSLCAGFGWLDRAKSEVWAWLVAAFWAWSLEQTVPRPLLCFVLETAIRSRQEISKRWNGLDIPDSSTCKRSLAFSHLVIQMYLCICSQRHIYKFFKGERQLNPPLTSSSVIFPCKGLYLCTSYVLPSFLPCPFPEEAFY